MPSLLGYGHEMASESYVLWRHRRLWREFWQRPRARREGRQRQASLCLPVQRLPRLGESPGAAGRCLERGAKPQPLPVLDRRERHVHGPLAGGLVERSADELHALARAGGLGRGGIARVQPARGVPGLVMQHEDPPGGIGLGRVPDEFTAGIDFHDGLLYATGAALRARGRLGGAGGGGAGGASSPASLPSRVRGRSSSVMPTR